MQILSRHQIWHSPDNLLSATAPDVVPAIERVAEHQWSLNCWKARKGSA